MGDLDEGAPTLVLHGMDLSYFTGKLQAYLRAKGIVWRHREMNLADLRRCAAATGIAQMPAVEFPDGTWATDTTPTIRLLESRYPEPAITPADPAARFAALLLEDYADEWLWRPALYYRWAFDTDARLMSRRIAQSLIGGPAWTLPLTALFFKARQRRVYLRGEGVTRRTRGAVEGLYHRTLRDLDAVLRTRPFLMGERPTEADFGFFGPMFRHFFCDPTPGRIMRDTAPAVLEWVARMWNLGPDRVAAAAPVTCVPDGLGPLFAAVGAEYLPYLLANEAAFFAGCRVLRYRDGAGVTWRMPTNPYRVHCLDVLRREFGVLDVDAQADMAASIGPDITARTLAAPRRAGVPDLVPVLPITAPPALRPAGRRWIR